MEEKPVFEEAKAIVEASFELQARQPAASEEELLAVLARQIEAMLDGQHDLLFGLLYRHDVSEKAIRAALDPSAPEPGHMGLARAVLERQKQKILAKKAFKSPDSEELKGFQW